MRQMFAAAMLFVLLAVSANALEMEAYTFMDGLYSFEAPADWVVEADEDNLTGVGMTPRDGSTETLLITTPNPHVEGDLQGYAGAYAKTLFDQAGGGEIDEVSDGEFQGRPAVIVTFTMGSEAGAVEGFVLAFDAQGYGVAFLATARPDDEEFSAAVQDIMDSYELDEDLLEKHESALRLIGKNALEELDALMR